VATYDDIKARVQTAADGLAVAGGSFPAARVALGSAGTVTWAGDDYDTGRAWGASPFEVLVEGLADWWDNDVDSPATIKAKVNELIAAYTQLVTDYDGGTVPTTAPPVLPIP